METREGIYIMVNERQFVINLGKGADPGSQKRGQDNKEGHTAKRCAETVQGRIQEG